MSDDMSSFEKACRDLGITPPASVKVDIQMRDKEGNLVDEVKRDYKRDLLIDERLLSEMLIVQPMIYAYYSGMLAKARNLEQMFDNELRRILAQTTIDVKAWLAGEGAKPTNPIIEAYVEVDEKVVKAREDLAEAKTWVDKLKTAVDALYHKRECISQLSNNRRKEMEMDMQRRVMRSGVE